MSKVGFWLRGSKGKLGGSYLSKGPDGATVQHVIGEVKNPRTLAQMQQRMVMATAMAAYSGMKEIVDHSFEDITYGQPTMSEFIKLNAKMLRENIGKLAAVGEENICNYNDYKSRIIWPNPYIISKGSISYNAEVFSDSDASILDLRVPFEFTNRITLRNALKKLGISENGYLTTLAIVYDRETGYNEFGWARYTPKKDELDTEIDGLSVQNLFEVESNVPVEMDVEQYNDSFDFSFDFDQSFNCLSVALILSDKGLKWKRSSAIMETRWSHTPLNPAETALATYPIGGDYVLNGGNV